MWVRIGSGTNIYSAENIDEFLYIRRNRPDLSAPNFAELIEVAERERQIAIMSRDFERVKRGEITLEESCLMSKETTIKYTVKSCIRFDERPSENVFSVVHYAGG